MQKSDKLRLPAMIEAVCHPGGITALDSMQLLAIEGPLSILAVEIFGPSRGDCKRRQPPQATATAGAQQPTRVPRFASIAHFSVRQNRDAICFPIQDVFQIDLDAFIVKRAQQMCDVDFYALREDKKWLRLARI